MCAFREYVRAPDAFLVWVIPIVFRTRRSLAALNVVAVGLAIATATTAAFLALWVERGVNWACVVGIPTTIIATAWAAILRSREKVGRVNIGWLLSVPLAASNAGVACALMLYTQAARTDSLLMGFFLGATFGIIAWAPALMLVLGFFGWPIAHARALAEEGLAGEDRGERIVGFASTFLSVAAVALALSTKNARLATTIPLVTMAALSAACGTTAAVIAQRRELRRRAFVARVEADEVPGLKVIPRAVGKVLVRVEPQDRVTYRVAPKPDEELFELDDAGRVIRSSA